jgi:4-carboxymuconolactone decarboxylase
MKHRTAALCLALVIAVPGIGRAEENVRFPPLSPEQLTPEQKAWADSITARQWTAQYEWHAHYPLAMKAGLDPKVADDIAHGVRPTAMKDDETALYDLAMALYRDKKVPDAIYKVALDKFGERGIMDIIGIMGYYDITSMTLITMQADAPKDSAVVRLPDLSK